MTINDVDVIGRQIDFMRTKVSATNTKVVCGNVNVSATRQTCNVDKGNVSNVQTSANTIGTRMALGHAPDTKAVRV